MSDYENACSWTLIAERPGKNNIFLYTYVNNTLFTNRIDDDENDFVIEILSVIFLILFVINYKN